MELSSFQKSEVIYCSCQDRSTRKQTLIPANASLDIGNIVRFASDFWLHFGEYVTLILTVSITLLVFWILLGGKYEDKRRLSVSLSLTLVGLVLTTVISPFGKDLNALIIGTLLSPLVAYIIGILKDKRKFWNEVDKVSHDYRRRLVEQESQIIGELLGELSTHAAAFKSYGIQEIEAEKWNTSSKVGLISDIHTLLIARYYYFVPLFNRIAKGLNELVEKGKSSGKPGNTDCLKRFSELKKAFLETETAVFHTLIYDLGLLQQKYLARPTVGFPIHMSFLLRKRLERFGILKESESLKDAQIFSETNIERFNLKMVAHLNSCFATLGLRFREMEKSLDKTRQVLKE